MIQIIIRHAAAALFISATLASAASAQNANVTGTWTLVSSVSERDGTKTDQFGPGAQGMLSLDAAGHFMLTILGPDLPKFASGDRAAGTAEENKAVISRSIAMIGTYIFNPDARR
jgi:hypothetical protein